MLKKTGQMPHDVSIGRLKSRIQQMKGEEPLEDNELKRWSHRPFLFRLANHFGNGLFGHARSFPQRAQVRPNLKKKSRFGLGRTSLRNWPGRCVMKISISSLQKISKKNSSLQINLRMQDFMKNY